MLFFALKKFLGPRPGFSNGGQTPDRSLAVKKKKKNLAIAYASHTLNQAEANYSVTHQETLGIVWALKHFRDIILRYPFTVFTDHAPVTELFEGRNLTGRLARWYLTVQEFGTSFKVWGGGRKTPTEWTQALPVEGIGKQEGS